MLWECGALDAGQLDRKASVMPVGLHCRIVSLALISLSYFFSFLTLGGGGGRRGGQIHPFLSSRALSYDSET